MPTIKIVKTKARRGLNSQLKQIVPDQGELVATTDTKRLFVGTGVALGGVVVGSKIHGPIANTSGLTSIVSEVGDIVPVNGQYYQLVSADYTSLASWTNMGTAIDSTTFQYDSSNTLTLKSGSLSTIHFSPSIVADGIKIDSNKLKVDFNTKSLELSSGQLSLKASGINEREIASSTFGNGIVGGSGDKIVLDVDPANFYFSSGKLSLSGDFPFTLQFTDLSSGWFGDGLFYNTITSKVTAVTDGTTITSLSGSLALAATSLSGTPEWGKLDIDKYGRVTSHTSSIFDTLTGNSALGSFNVTNSLSSIFNGSPSTTISGGVPGLDVTYFSAVSSNGSTVVLSSAGFITFEGNTTTRNGQQVGRFAIPIFAY